MAQLTKALTNYLAAGKRQPTRAKLGDGLGNVSVTGRAGYVWCQVDGHALQVWNDVAPEIVDLPVWIGYDPRTPNFIQVLEVDRSSFQGEASYTAVRLHADTHTWLGIDVLPVWCRQIMDGRVNIIGTWLVQVTPGVVNSMAVNATVFDLSGDVPVSGALFVLVYVDANGFTATRVGTPVTVNLTFADIPAIAVGEYGLAAVRLYAGQTALVESTTDTDIIDLRFLQSRGVQGSGSVDQVVVWQSNGTAGGSSSLTFDGTTLAVVGIVQSKGRKIAVVSKSADYNLTASDELVIFTAAATANLLAATGSGRKIQIKNLSSGTVTVDGNASETIDGSTTVSIYPYESITIVDYGVGTWAIIAGV